MEIAVVREVREEILMPERVLEKEKEEGLASCSDSDSDGWMDGWMDWGLVVVTS